MVGFGILLDFVGVLEDWGEGGFLSWCVDESAIPGIEKQNIYFGFCHPLYHKITVFLHFSVVEQIFDRIKYGLLEQI